MAANDHGESVRQRRESLLLTQQQVAALAGVSDETYRKVEHGMKVSPRTLKSVLDALAAEEAKAHAAAKTEPAGGTRNPPSGSVTHVDAQGRVVETDGPTRAHLLGLVEQVRHLLDEIERDVEEDQCADH